MRTFIIIVTLLLFMGGCSDSQEVTKTANGQTVGVVPTGGTINAVSQENGVLPYSFDQDFVCFDSTAITYFNLTLASNRYIYENGNYAGTYATDGHYLDLYFSSNGTYYNTYDIIVNDSLDFFQAVNDSNSLISCITTRHSETDKIISTVTISCPTHGTFQLNSNGYSQDSNSYYVGTYYANMQTGEFLLHYMSVDNSGNIGLFNFPAQVRSMNVIDVIFPDGTEQCSYQ